MTFWEANTWTEWLMAPALLGTSKANPYMAFIRWWIRDRPDLLGMLEVQGCLHLPSDLRDSVFHHIRNTLMSEDARRQYERTIGALQNMGS